MPRVLVVEDDPQLLRALVTNLQARRDGIEPAPDGTTALRLADAHRPDAVLLDLGLPVMVRLRPAVHRTETAPLTPGNPLVAMDGFAIDLLAVRAASAPPQQFPTER